MADFEIIPIEAIEKTALGWDTVFLADRGYGEWKLAGKAVDNPNGLQADASIATGIVISLFTDRRAPDGWRPEIQDRRGWWGDAIQPDSEPLDPLGSWLWLLENERMSARIVADAKLYAELALAWMVRDGLAARVNVASEARDDNRGINLSVEVFASDGARVYARRFDILWQQV